MGRLPLGGVLHAERPREVGGTACCSVHGPGKGYQADGTNRVYQVCPVTDVQATLSGGCGFNNSTYHIAGNFASINLANRTSGSTYNV